jgi:hypothetical protein
MKGILVLAALAFLLPGCCVRERQAMNLLPEGAVVFYEELLDRAKLQVNVATEAFYVDDWAELKKVALALEQTARFLPKAPDLPKDRAKEVTQKAQELSKECLQLAQEAQAKDIKGVNARLQSINLHVRAFHAAPEK